MPPAQSSSTPPVAPAEPGQPLGPTDQAAAADGPEGGTDTAVDSDDVLDARARARYLDEVMADIDAEVGRRRASGDLPVRLEQELDELFLEFSPIGLQGKARLRETLALVDGSAYVDMAVPVASQKLVGTYVKRLIRKSISWYLGFIVHQIVRFAWSVSRMFHVLVDHVEDLEAAVETQRTPELPATAVPVVDPGSAWWADRAVAALTGADGRVLHAECGNGSLLDLLVAAGVDAYGVDPADAVIEGALERGLDVRAESALGHLEVVTDQALGGIVLSGSVQWLHPNERDRLLRLAASRLVIGGLLVLHSATPESWMAGSSPLLSDLAPGRPLHAETWEHLLLQHGFSDSRVTRGGVDHHLERVAATNPDAGAINGAIDAVNALLLGPSEYLLVARRTR